MISFANIMQWKWRRDAIIRRKSSTRTVGFLIGIPFNGCLIRPLVIIVQLFVNENVWHLSRRRRKVAQLPSLCSPSPKRIPRDDEDNKDSLVLQNRRYTATESRSFADFFPPWLHSLQSSLPSERLKKWDATTRQNDANYNYKWRTNKPLCRITAIALCDRTQFSVNYSPVNWNYRFLVFHFITLISHVKSHFRFQELYI